MNKIDVMMDTRSFRYKAKSHLITRKIKYLRKNEHNLGDSNKIIGNQMHWTWLRQENIFRTTNSNHVYLIVKNTALWKSIETSPYKKKQYIEEVFIQTILMSGRRHKNLNLLIEFSNSIFIKFCFKAYKNMLTSNVHSK